MEPEGLTVAELFVYPTKSGRGCRVGEARALGRGLEGDRAFMVVDERGDMLTQRDHPELGLLETVVSEDAVTFSALEERVRVIGSELARDERRVRVWSDEVVAEDCGPAAAGLVTHLTGRLARIVRIGEAFRRPVDQAFARPSDEVSFADGFPILVTTRASTTAIADLAGVAAASLRFRPNLVVSGAAAFEEDAWTTLRIGEVVLELVKPCTRCQVVDVDPATSERDGRVLSVLAKERRAGRGVVFGQNALVRVEGVVRVGDAVIAS